MPFRHRRRSHVLLAGQNVRASFVEYTKRAGVDPDRAEKDITANEKAIVAILARNHEQAEAFEFQGMPAFIVGRFRMPGVFSAENFKRAVADARLAAKSKWAAKWTACQHRGEGGLHETRSRSC